MMLMHVCIQHYLVFCWFDLLLLYRRDIVVAGSDRQNFSTYSTVAASWAKIAKLGIFARSNHVLPLLCPSSANHLSLWLTRSSFPLASWLGQLPENSWMTQQLHVWLLIQPSNGFRGTHKKNKSHRASNFPLMRRTQSCKTSIPGVLARARSPVTVSASDGEIASRYWMLS